MESYPAIERNEVMIHATTWMNLENIMLSEISQIQKTSIICFHLYEISRIDKFIETETRSEVTRGLEKGGSRELLFNG